MVKKQPEKVCEIICTLHEDNILEFITLVGIIGLLFVGWVKLLQLGNVRACAEQSQRIKK